MPAVVSKAVIFNVAAFLADNNVRRNIGTYSLNYTSPTSNVVTNSLTLNVGDTFTWNTTFLSSNMTYLVSSEPLRVSFTLAPLSPTPSYSVDMKKSHLVDSDVRQVVIQNLGSTVANLTIIQS